MSFDIVSPANERIKRLARLRDRKHRDAEGVFLVEGERLVSRAVDAGLAPVEVYTDGSLASRHLGPVTTVDPSVLDRASYRSRSEGLIAVFEQFDLKLSEFDSPPGPLTLVAESIEKPGNLGAMLRTADAVGADAFVAVGDSVDPFNPNAIRASTGAIFSVPLAQGDLSELAAWLGEVPMVAADPGGACRYWDHHFEEKTAIIVGAEDEGISEEARALAAASVSIPMVGPTDSLNASVSMALLAYEALRQRRSR